MRKRTSDPTVPLLLANEGNGMPALLTTTPPGTSIEDLSATLQRAAKLRKRSEAAVERRATTGRRDVTE